jgi:N-sulfoglucosamine sulfohydrolase
MTKLLNLSSLVLGLSLSLAPAAKKPNILFMLSDDHSYPFLSTYGDTNVKTPVIDKLAAEGMKFHRYYTTAPQCVPSRFSSPLMREEIIYP